MKSKSDFWLSLHKLANDLKKEGDTADEQAESVCEVFNSLGQASRSVYIEDLRLVLPALEKAMVVCKPDSSAHGS